MPYFERRIYAGPVLEIKRYMATKGGRPRGSKKKHEAGAADDLNDVQSWRKLTRLLNCNFCRANGDMCLTLKFSAWVERDEAMKEYERFLKQVRYIRKKRALPPLKYIIVREVQSGRQHAHIVMSGGIGLEELTQLWGRGNVWASVLEDATTYKELASYLTRQHKPRRGGSDQANAKEPRQRGQRRWSASRNLQKPEVRKRECRTVTLNTMPRAPKGYRLLPDFQRGDDTFGFLWIEWTCIREDAERSDGNALRRDGPDAGRKGQTAGKTAVHKGRGQKRGA